MAQIDKVQLQSNYQNVGDIYSDVDTEACFELIADAHNETDQKLTLSTAPGAVDTIRIAEKAVTRSRIAPGAVGANQLDPSLLQQYGDIATNAKFELIDSELEQKAQEKFVDQYDFVESLKRHINYKGSFNILPNNVTDNFNVSVLYDIGNGKAISYTIYKQAGVDDFIKLGIGRYGNLQTVQNLFAQKNFDSRTGAWNDIATYYTSQVGATMTVSFYGSQLVFHHHVDDRGGYWRFIIDGDNSNPVDVSTWAGSPGDLDTLIFSKTTNANHTVVATFMGDDPSHTPSGGVGTSRGWANFISGQYTFNTYVYGTTNSAIIEPIVGASNWEWAFQIRKHGTTNPYYFVPYHGTVTAFKVHDPIFIVDGVPTAFQVALAINGAKELKVVQSVYGRVPENPGENLIKVSTVTTFRGDGTINVDGKLEVLSGVDVALGYVDMLPLNPAFAKMINTSIGNSYPTVKADGSVTELTEEGDKAIGYIGLNNETYRNLGVAMRINNPKQTLRQGETGKGSTFIQHRSDNNQKLYPQVYNNTYLPPGYTQRFSATYFIGEISELYALFG